ncbi:hypothetical protein [Clostridium sp. CF012]|uniref:hypothetical protein n=1 Tax=Clostridium sp. CF012 TaxID=2843319 RepID=UPI001C0AAE81|nr:hypothetical protein [Clostridium sp. CF012]MBU3142233.1 hypothetical protein [Clostridium sp. CF012]
MNKVQYYNCYSINMLRFIKANFVYPISKADNPNTGRTAWIFIKTKELDIALTQWSKLQQNTKYYNKVDFNLCT